MEYFRKFVLTDITGNEQFALNDFSDYLAHTPTGLGIYRQSEYISVQNRKISVNNKNAFKKLTLSIFIFGKRVDLENKYARLRNFVEKNILNGFRLYYTPQEETRYIECDINVLDKTEKNKGYMNINLEIYPKTLWLKDVEGITLSLSNADESNLFAFGYDEDIDTYHASFDEIITNVYGIQFGIGNTAQVEISNNGMAESQTLIRIYGSAVNPILRMYPKNDNTPLQFIKFNDLSVAQGEYIEINGNQENAYIVLVSANGQRTNIENFVDIESNMFITIPRGEYRFELTDDTSSSTSYATIFFKEQYYGG